MIKWALTLVICVFIIGIVMPLISRRGRLPGDVGVRYRGRDYWFPFASTLLLSLLLWIVLRVL